MRNSLKYKSVLIFVLFSLSILYISINIILSSIIIVNAEIPIIPTKPILTYSDSKFNTQLNQGIVPNFNFKEGSNDADVSTNYQVDLAIQWTTSNNISPSNTYYNEQIIDENDNVVVYQNNFCNSYLQNYNIQLQTYLKQNILKKGHLYRVKVAVCAKDTGIYVWSNELYFTINGNDIIGTIKCKTPLITVKGYHVKDFAKIYYGSFCNFSVMSKTLSVRNVNLIYSDYDKSIVSIDDKGVLVGLKIGSTVVKISSSDSRIKDVYMVVIVKKLVLR